MRCANSVAAFLVMDTTLGILLVTLAGLAVDSCLWPMKRTRRFRVEHDWFIGMLPLVVVPWAVVLAATSLVHATMMS
jgi:hypothetical protein